MPPATSLVPCIVNARTSGVGEPTAPSTPDPSGDHAAPSKRAIRLAGCPAAAVKTPPTITLGPSTRIALTVPLTPLAAPVPSGDQPRPLKCATLLACRMLASSDE